MSSPSKALLLIILGLAIICPSYVVAQSPAPSPAPDCPSVLLNLYPCLDFAGGNDTAPSKNCCIAFSDFVKHTAICLCDLVFGNTSADYGINQTKAMELPSRCKVKTPPISLCPAAAPSSAAPSPGSSPTKSGSSPSPTSMSPPSTSKSPGVTPSNPSATPSNPSATPSMSPTSMSPPSTSKSPGGMPQSPSPNGAEAASRNFLFVMALAVLSVRLFVI